MADFTTHHIFGQQVLAAAKPNIITCIEENLGAFCWGLQGPDLLYFHRAVVAGSPLPQYGRMIHGEKTAELFKFLVKDIISHCKMLDFDILAAYYFGFCCHYALDSKIHPYVFSRQYQIEDAASEPPKDNSAHWKVESGIDNELYPMVCGESIGNFNVNDYYNIDKESRRIIAGLLSRVLKSVYSVDVRPQTIQSCFVDGIWINKLLYDKSGMMKPFGAMVQSLLKNYGKFAAHFKTAPSSTDDFLNSAKKTWYHWGEKRDRNESVMELMDEAKDMALHLWDISDKAFHTGNRHAVTDYSFAHTFVDGKRI